MHVMFGRSTEGSMKLLAADSPRAALTQQQMSRFFPKYAVVDRSRHTK